MNRRFWLDLALVILITALALCVRIYRLDEVPAGLYADEAANGVDTLDVLAGQHPIFFERNFGREPLFIYLQSLAVAALGVSPWALRLTAAIIGALTVPAVYWMVREAFAMTDLPARWLATWTALFVAFSYWHLNFSRIGFRAIMLPFMSAIAFAWFWRAWRRLDAGESFPQTSIILCGVFIGATLYTYTAGRVLPVLVLLVAAIGIIQKRKSIQHVKRMIKASMIIVAVAFVVFLPLAIYSLQHPASANGRFWYVSIMNPAFSQGSPLKAAATNIIKTIGMFAFTSDQELRHNPAARPLLDYPLALWLLVGLILAARRYRSLPHVFALAWFGLYALPAALTANNVPHYLRSIGMIPAVFLLPVLAMLDIGGRVPDKRRWLGVLIPVPFLLFSGINSLSDYFSAWQSPSRFNDSFDIIFAEVVPLMARSGQPDGVWVVPVSPVHYDASYTNYTMEFLGRGLFDYGLVVASQNESPQRLSALAKGHRVAYLVHWRSEQDQPKGAYFFADPRHLVDFLLRKYGDSIGTTETSRMTYTTYQIPTEPAYQVASTITPLDVSFGETVRLTGVAYGHTAISSSEPANTLEEKWLPAGHAAWVTLRWQPQTPIAVDLKTTVYLTDESGHRVGQTDDLLVGSSYPFTKTWETNDIVDTYHIVPTLPAIPPGTYKLFVGVYEDSSLKRYVASSTSLNGDFFLGTIEITHPIAPPMVAPSNPLSPNLALTTDVWLSGYDLSSQTVSPGDRLPLTLYWRATTQPTLNYEVILQLIDTKGHVILEDAAPVGSKSYPTSAWRAGDVILQWLNPVLPSQVPAGRYQVAVALRPESGLTGLPRQLLEITVEGRPHDFEVPIVSHPTLLRLGDTVAYLGHDIDSDTALIGGKVRLTLHWQATQPSLQPYTVFVHLLGPDGRIWAQQDTTPGQGTLPTNSWVPSEYIQDRYELQVPPDAPAGEYTIEVGMYDAVTGLRLTVTDASGRFIGDHVVLPTLQVMAR